MNNPTPQAAGRARWSDRLITALAAVAVVAIAVVAAIVSYRHALTVARDHGETGATAYMTPITIDGLVVVASMVMLDAARRRQHPPGLAWCALAMGIGATLAVNILYGVQHGLVGAVIAAWPAVALTIAVELLMGMIRRRAVPAPAPVPVPVAEGGAAPATAPATAAAGGETGPATAPAIAEEQPKEEAATAPATAPATAAAGGETGPEEVAATGEETETGAVRPLPELIAAARERYAPLLAAGRLPSVRQLRREMRVGHPKAVALRAALVQAAALRAA
ncbi:DUF2637 domain-containing protein [uncultured Thermomonospora sp.]|uniref:DUF2637 domain-containing protein n=1 Tax=uncultured Thermomonospora sp. TaxID=671175 RepID=UPI00259AFF6B|nr:DUF2637 domain-containing protein [uncultured Thermomonospora sp.]